MIPYYIHSTAPIDKFNLFPNTLVFIFNLGAISFFHTKLIVQAYGQLGHRVQDSAVCSGLTHLIRGSLRGFSPAGQSLTSSEVDKVIA